MIVVPFKRGVVSGLYGIDRHTADRVLGRDTDASVDFRTAVFGFHSARDRVRHRQFPYGRAVWRECLGTTAWGLIDGLPRSRAIRRVTDSRDVPGLGIRTFGQIVSRSIYLACRSRKGRPHGRQYFQRNRDGLAKKYDARCAIYHVPDGFVLRAAEANHRDTNHGYSFKFGGGAVDRSLAVTYPERATEVRLNA